MVSSGGNGFEGRGGFSVMLMGSGGRGEQSWYGLVFVVVAEEDLVSWEVGEGEKWERVAGNFVG